MTTTSVTQRIASSASQVIAAIDAIRNMRALVLVFSSLGLAALVMGLGLALSNVSFIFPLVFGLLAVAITFYGVNASGIVLMDEAKGVRTTARDALLRSLGSSHRLLLLMLLVGAIYLAGTLALLLVFLVCKIPFVGPVLYTVVFPLSVLVCGAAFLALFLVVTPLAAPAIWNGATTTQAVVHLFAIARQKLPQVVLLMLLLSLVCAVIAGLLVAVLLNGTLIAGGLSAALLSGGLIGGLDAFSLMSGRGGSYAIAGAVGLGVLYALVLSLPALIYVRGCCAVYLANVGDVDTDAMEQQMKARVAATREKAQAQLDAARVAAQQAAAAKAATTTAETATVAPAAPTTPAGPVTPEPADAPVQVAEVAQQPPAQKDESTALACPACHAPHQDDDSFCGSCGARLNPAT